MDFYNFNDNELIYYIKEHNEKALQIFLEKYNILSKKIIKDMKFHSFEAEEALADCNELILKCLKMYKNEYASFYSYYVVSLKRALLKRKEKTKKSYTLNEDDYVRLFHKTVEKRNEYISSYLSRCSNFQKKISGMILDGYSVKNISKILNVPTNKIYYELRKISKHE